jgi:hypothetical protein
MGHMHKPLANAFTCIRRDRNTWTLLDRKRQIYSISKCLFLWILLNNNNKMLYFALRALCILLIDSFFVPVSIRWDKHFAL